ncbi:MAG: hypothetical protein GY702_07560 [Desulfobulbaceae bacterium]|nr:hypothetical protein [Desulfobulbaceae bacterium]
MQKKEFQTTHEEFIMRGTYEAFILVKVKDGRKFVCALNRKPANKEGEKLSLKQQQDYLEHRVIWN